MQTKLFVMYNVPRRSDSEVVCYLLQLGLLGHTENEAHFVSILHLEAKMFKIKKCILNYACFKHP